MPRGDTISLMADEVLRDIQEKGVKFHQAFAWAAHRRGVFQTANAESREQYNTWFAQVHARVSARNKPALKQSLQGDRPWQHGKIVQTTCRRRKWRSNDPWGHEDEDNFIFPENQALLERLHLHLPLTDD